MEGVIGSSKFRNMALIVALMSMAMIVGGLAARVNDIQTNLSFLKQQQVVKGLDLKRYSGRWYEIAKFPTLYEPQNSVNTRAIYTIKTDGTVDVLNETFLKGKRIFIKGYAYKANPKSDEAKLKVKFDTVPVLGDYWVLYVDCDYQYAVVGEPFRTSLFILSRKNMIDEQMYNQLVQKAAKQGYQVSKLIKTPQTNPPPS